MPLDAGDQSHVALPVESPVAVSPHDALRLRLSDDLAGDDADDREDVFRQAQPEGRGIERS